jgi:putative transposase
MRTARVTRPGIVYHLISRFVDREWFFDHHEERETYLRLLAHALSEADWRCLAYALMSSHIHLAMVAGEDTLASWVRRVHSPFADWMNRRHDRIGPLFVRGPKDYAVRPQNEGKLIAYIHNNPVDAGVVSRARDSDWTSHRAYVQLCAPEWLQVDEGLARAGFTEPANFERWVDVTPGDPSIVELGMIRRTARKRGAIELGTPTAGERGEVPLVARPWSHIRSDPRDIIAAVVSEIGVSAVDICSRRKSGSIVAARRLVVHCGIGAGHSGSDMGSVLGISQQAASKLYRTSLDAFEREKYALVLERLEARRVRLVPARRMRTS